MVFVLLKFWLKHSCHHAFNQNLFNYGLQTFNLYTINSRNVSLDRFLLWKNFAYFCLIP